MGPVAPPHISCIAFNQVNGLSADGIHRFVVGEDATPRRLTTVEAEAELGDLFATTILLKGVFPHTAQATVDAIKAVGGSLATQRSFVLGEGSQVPFTPGSSSLVRGIRFVIACGDGPDGPDVLISAFRPKAPTVELMAWDQRRGGFNFYRTVGDTASWVFAGNSRHALTHPTQGNGPFESHLSGTFVMKELRAPWVHWESPDAHILPSAFASGDERRTHPWFTAKEGGGAFTCETRVARPSIERWTKVRFAELKAAGTIEDPDRVLVQVVESRAVNLVSSKSLSNGTDPVIVLPPTFFLDTEGLSTALARSVNPTFSVARPTYAKALTTFAVTLTDGQAFAQPGDTHFAFVVPERAFEDQAALTAGIELGLVTDKLAACLLMVDFPNPVFSTRRAALRRFCPSTAIVQAKQSAFSQTMGDAIVAASMATPAGSPEREFAELWSISGPWQDEFAKRIARYVDAVNARLATQQGFDDVYRLAESRRAQVGAMPISESPLLFARSNVPGANRVMRADGSVAAA
jgi:hypothetical protein